MNSRVSGHRGVVSCEDLVTHDCRTWKETAARSGRVWDSKWKKKTDDHGVLVTDAVKNAGHALPTRLKAPRRKDRTATSTAMVSWWPIDNRTEHTGGGCVTPVGLSIPAGHAGALGLNRAVARNRVSWAGLSNALTHDKALRRRPVAVSDRVVWTAQDTQN